MRSNRKVVCSKFLDAYCSHLALPNSLPVYFDEFTIYTGIAELKWCKKDMRICFDLTVATAVYKHKATIACSHFLA